METLPSLLFAAVLLFFSGGWMVWHARSWRSAQGQSLAAREYDFRRRQFRRRMQTSAMVAALALAIAIGPRIVSPPWLVVSFWLGVVLVVFWIGLLALADAVVTRLYYSRLDGECQVERKRLEAELRRLEAEGREDAE